MQYQEYIPKIYGFNIYGKKGSKYYDKKKSNKQKEIKNNENIDSLANKFNNLSVK